MTSSHVPSDRIDPDRFGVERSHPLSRRQFLGALGAAATGGLFLPAGVAYGSGVSTDSLTGLLPFRLAMHVHGSWSEGLGSWEAQFAQAAANAVDVLYLTDHDARGTAYNYLTSLSGVTWVRSQSGSLAQNASTVAGGSFRLLAESSSASAAASTTLQIQPKPMAFNRFRTSIAGLTIRQTTTSCSLTGGARYELVLDLSYHPASGGRPAGNYQLRYRFGASSSARYTEGGGLVGVVASPTPAAGSTVDLVPVTDVAAIWPGMLAMDNASYGLSFVAVSPNSGAVADVRISGVSFIRSQSDPASVIANQAQIVTTYGPRYPNLAVRRSTEVSRHLPDMNPFGVPQFFPDYALDTDTNHDAFYRDLVQDVHAASGVISWNHPFGYNTGPLLSAADRATKRRQTFASMRAVNQYGVDLVEVGYTLRGNVDAATHIDLWDTFSRSGVFLTGNGTTDDHGGQGWKNLSNGFVTGVWAAAKSDSEIVAALKGGRAYAVHMGWWPQGELDLLVDGAVPMGQVSVSSKTSRKIVMSANTLPATASVQVVAGPVDYSGNPDPGTSVLRTFAASAFAGGTKTIWVNTSTSRFYRLQVVNSAGQIIGISNPVWLLRTAPPTGIPPARAA